MMYTLVEQHKQIEALRARNAALVAMLKEMEWAEGICLICGQPGREGHAAECALAKLLKEP